MKREPGNPQPGRVSSALKWATLAQALERVVSWTVTLIVIRLLSPEDYGLMAISVVLINIAGLLDDLGLNAALIQKRRLQAHVAPRIYGAVLLTSLVALGVVQVTAAPFADFYEDNRIEPIARVLSFTLVLGAAASVPTALLLRDIEFRTISLLEIGRTVLSSLLVLWLAWTGWGVWALVYGSVTSSLLRALGIVSVTRFALRPDFRVAGMRSELRFGALVMAKGFVSALNRNVGPLLIGRLLGIAPLGVFQIANDVPKMPVRALLRPAARVSFPTVSRLQDDLASVRRFYLRITSSLLFVLLPACWGLAVVANEFVILVLGAKWAAAAPVLTIISLFIPLRAITRPLQSALDGIGRPDVGLANLLTISVCIVPAIIAGARWGLLGVAIGWSSGQLLAMLLNLRRSLPILGLGWPTLVGAVGPGLAAAALMSSGVWLARSMLDTSWPLPMQTGFLVTLGIVLYIAGTLLLNRQVAAEAVMWMRSRTA